MTDVNPNRWGEPMNRPEGNPRPSGREGGQMALSGLSAIGFAYSTTPVDIMIWGTMLNFFNLGAWGIIYAYTPELFREGYRATGVGSSGSIARIGMIIGPMIPAIQSFETALAIYSATWILGSLAVLAAPETRPREAVARAA
jgi:putative MFS transporter